MPSVSVITPLYNGASFIEDCIESVARQSFDDLEHIVIDNDSSDDGPDRVRALLESHPRLKLVHSKTPGAGPTRNVGIEEAQGRFIAFLDADDTWKPSKLKTQIERMRFYDQVFSWSGYDIWRDDACLRYQPVPIEASFRDIVTKRVVIGCLTAVYDCERLGKRFMNDMPLRQDFCLFADIARDAEGQGLPFGGINQSLANYRLHESNGSANKARAASMQWRAYRDHFGYSRLRSGLLFGGYAARALKSRLQD
mgnify:CR=1 FL=1